MVTHEAARTGSDAERDALMAGRSLFGPSLVRPHRRLMQRRGSRILRPITGDRNRTFDGNKESAGVGQEAGSTKWTR